MNDLMDRFKNLWYRFNAYLNSDKVVQTAKRILIFEIVAIIIINLIIHNTNHYEFDAPPVLSLLVSVISVIIAIIITYLFSKLFAEKSERIQRKYLIDELSHKVTMFRKMAFHIKGMYKFWETCNNNPKGILDGKFKELTYYQYRSLNYDDLMAIDKEIGGNAQAYLALKGLENGESTYSFYSTFKPTNYSLDEITCFNEYAGSFWHFLDRSQDHIHFENVHSYWKEPVNISFKEITGRNIDTDNYRREIKELFGDIQSEVFDKIFYLISLNDIKFPKLFFSGLTNLLIFLIILIISLIIYVVNPEIMNMYYTTITLVSFFIANTFDLVVIIWLALKNELTIKDFYKI